MSVHLSRLIVFGMLCTLSGDVTKAESMTNHFSLMQATSVQKEAKEQMF